MHHHTNLRPGKLLSMYMRSFCEANRVEGGYVSPFVLLQYSSLLINKGALFSALEVLYVRSHGIVLYNIMILLGYCFLLGHTLEPGCFHNFGIFLRVKTC